MNPEDLQPGKRVRVIGAPDRQGSIGAIPQDVEGRWFVRVNFDDGARRNTPVEHLETLPEHRDAISEIEGGRFHGPESLRRNLLHEKLNGRLSDVVYTAPSKETAPEPPVLDKLQVEQAYLKEASSSKDKKDIEVAKPSATSQSAARSPLLPAGLQSVPVAALTVDLVLGVDFGTSCTKAVVGDPIWKDRSYAVSFDPANDDISAWLHPTRFGDEANLKMRLMDDPE